MKVWIVSSGGLSAKSLTPRTNALGSDSFTRYLDSCLDAWRAGRQARRKRAARGQCGEKMILPFFERRTRDIMVEVERRQRPQKQIAKSFGITYSNLKVIVYRYRHRNMGCICNEYDGKGLSACGVVCPEHKKSVLNK